MKILFETSECAPFSKSGGLADVAFSLPGALKDNGHEVAIITPLYKCVKDRFGEGLRRFKKTNITLGDRSIPCALWRGKLGKVPVYFIENDDFFNRDKLYGYDDDKLRFAFFSKAVIDVMKFLKFVPDILHCNDWETALSILYLKDDQAVRPDYRNVKTVYTIHNIAYQGQFGASELYSTFGLVEGWYQGALAYEYQGRHDVNLMKGAMLMADAVSTVSPTYAKELHSHEFGKGLEGVCDLVEAKMYGILNGINMAHYDPRKDKRIPANFSLKKRDGKDICKAELQKEFGLKTEKDWPLFCSVARLVEQKGIELIKDLLPKLMEMGVQIIIYGQGDQSYIDFFNDFKEKYPDQFGFSSDYNEERAARVFAGSDFYLMPSSFEPCGLSQMMAMRYGTIPVVHETGGLKDSVRAYSDFDGVGDGFSFAAYNSKALLLAISQAVKIYFGQQDVFYTLRDRCMKKDFSWTKSALVYEKMYSDIAGGGSDPSISFIEAYNTLKELYEGLEESRNAYLATKKDSYSNIIQIRIEGPGEGTFHLKITKKDRMIIEPVSCSEADCFVAASLDNLVGMASGTVSADKLFITGQMKVDGNVSKGAQMRYLIGKKEF